MKDGDSVSLKYLNVTVYNNWMTQFDLFQTQTTIFKPLAKV